MASRDVRCSLDRALAVTSFVSVVMTSRYQRRRDYSLDNARTGCARKLFLNAPYRCNRSRQMKWTSSERPGNSRKRGIAPGGGETICPPPMAVRRWQKSRRIYVRPRTGPQSAHFWWPAVAKLQAKLPPCECVAFSVVVKYAV